MKLHLLSSNSIPENEKASLHQRGIERLWEQVTSCIDRNYNRRWSRGMFRYQYDEYYGRDYIFYRGVNDSCDVLVGTRVKKDFCFWSLEKQKAFLKEKLYPRVLSLPLFCYLDNFSPVKLIFSSQDQNPCLHISNIERYFTCSREWYEDLYYTWCLDEGIFSFIEEAICCIDQEDLYFNNIKTTVNILNCIKLNSLSDSISYVGEYNYFFSSGNISSEIRQYLPCIIAYLNTHGSFPDVLTTKGLFTLLEHGDQEYDVYLNKRLILTFENLPLAQIANKLSLCT